MLAIKVDGLAKKYGEIEVVKHISFQIGCGEVFGFLGPNGAGKTTSIRMMIGEIPRDDGQVEIMSHKSPEQLDQIRRIIGVVPDHQNLYDRLTVRQNLDFFADLYQVSQTRVDEVIAQVHLVEHQQKACLDLSRGLRQRALIARGLLHQPQIFFLDEPTSALDPISARLIRELVASLREAGTTIFLTTHYMEEADLLCDRLAIMHQGDIVACDSPGNLKNKFGRRTARVEYSLDNQIKTDEFEIDTKHGQSQLSDLINSGNIIKMHTQEATLEEVFMRVTGAQWKEEETTA